MKTQNKQKLSLKKLSLSVALLGLAGSLIGCSSNPAHQTFAPATEVITKTIAMPIQPTGQVEASFGYGNNPALIAAYQSYQKTGKAPHVTTDGFVGFPYDPSQQIYIACEPLHICTILFEQGELIKDMALGDTANWDVKTMLAGGAWPNGAEILVIKPKADHLATNLVITTDQRVYNIALMTSDKDYIRQAIFYYPSDTDASIAAAMTEALKEQSQHSQAVVTSLNNGTQVDLGNVNFDYRISGDNPTWKPTRVFDDGTHTIIQFPSTVASGTLPVLFVLNKDQDELVNFRKRTEANGSIDYIVDQVFDKAVLVSGVGSAQSKVIITNNTLDHSWF